MLLTLGAITCRDQPAGPSPVLGSVAVAPVFPSGRFVGGNLPITNVHAVVTRPSDPTPPLKDVIVPFNLNADQLQLKLQSIVLESAAESLDVTIELLSGTQVIFSGTQRLQATTSPNPTPAPPLPLTFVGPGAQLTTLFLAPLDSTLTQGDALPMRVSGEDASQVPVTSFYVSWSSSDTNIARVNGDGRVTGKVPRGMVYVRARTPATLQVPTGVLESTTVTLAPLPTGLQKVSGDLQGAAPGQPLSQPLVVKVVASDQLGVPGVMVTFTPPAGGAVQPLSVVTDANGLAQTTATLPPGGSGQVIFMATIAGQPAVTFGANFQAPPSPTWTGAISTDWNTTGNWNLNTVPVSSDSVTIPAGTTNLPLVTGTNATTGALLNNSTITLGSGVSLTAFGNVQGSGSIVGGGTTGALVLPTSGSVLDLATLPNVLVSGAVTLGRNVTVVGQLNVGGGGGLAFGGHTASVSSSFSTSGTATITMNNATDSLKVLGSITFDGGSTVNLLNAGVIFVGGDFTQLATTSARSYAPGGTHLLAFTGSVSQTVTFATPGANGSNLETLALANPSGNIFLGSDLYLTGPVGFAPGVPRIAHGQGHTLFVAELLASNATLDNLLVVANNVAITQFDSITFTNYSPSAIPLTITHPGAATPFVFNDLVFTVTPTTGFYISITDLNPTDGNPFTIDMVNPTPGTGAPFIQTAGGAVVTWPAAPAGVRTWTGTTSSDWSNPANWNPAIVPTPSDSVVIVAAPNAATFTAASNFAAAVNVTGGSLNLNGRTLSVARDFVTSGGGNLVMTSPTGTLNVVGNSTFGGANELGSMTAGTITVGGNLTQLASNSPDSYHPSGTHITTFNGVNQTISFATPGLVPGSSHLQEAVWSGSGTLSLATAVNAHGTFSILTSNATTIAGANQLLTVGGFNSSVNPTVFNGVQLRIDQATPTTLNVSNLSFINQSSTAIQLQISHPGAAAPTTLTNLTFSSVPSTGFYLSAIDLNPGNGLPFTIDMVNPNPVTPGGFVQTVGGAVVNWPGGPVPATWTGAVSTNWNTAGNWNTGVVPGTTTDAVIPSGTPNQPVTLSNPSNVQSLTVNGQLDMNGFNLIVHGNLLGTGLMVNSGVVANLIMQVGGTSLALPTIPNLRSTGGTVTLTGNVIVSGNVAVAATGGLDLGGKSMTVGGNLSVAGAGATLVMTSQTGILNVVGTVTFDGADETGKLTSGVLAAGGDFQVLNTNSAKAFVATGLHETIFSNATGPQNISMVNPGLSGNHFGNVALNTPGDFTLLNAPMFVESSFNSPGAGSVVHGNGFRIQASSADIQGLTLDNAPLQIVGTTTPPGLIIDDVTFNNMSTAVDQLEVILPGAPSSYAFNNLVFNTVPVNGKYLFANDNTADANPLTIDMVNPTPATDGGFTSTAGGAVINWPGVGGGQAVWTGLSDTDWNNPGNWQANQVPAAGSDVFMAAGAPNYPALISNEVVGNMEVQSGAVVDFVDATLQVTGSLVGNGSMTNGGPEMSGSGVELEMADLGSLLITGNVTLISDLDITSGGVLITGVPANLTVDAFALTMTGDLTLQNSGTMVMANPAGSVSVGGNALFDGGPENGLLTQGFLHVQGNFTQANSSTTSSFRTGPSFQTAFDGSSPQTIVMADSLNSFFSNLTLANNVTAGSMVLVQANLNVGNGVSVTATDLSFVGTGFDVRGGVTTAAGSLLQLGRLYVAGAMSIGGTYNTTSIIYTGSGQTAPSNLPYQFLYSTGTVTLAAGNATIGTLTTQGGTLTLGGRTTVNDVFLQTGTLKPNNHTLVVIGALQTLSTGTLTMQNALDSVLVTGLGAFGGGSTAGLMTDGVLKIGGSFAQTSGTSSLSFAPSGAHLTLLGAGGVRVVTFVSPGTGAGGSHFANLDVTAATGGLNLTSNIVADGALIAQPTGTAPTLTGGGKSVTALSLSVTAASTSLVLDNAPLIVNEQGTIRAQQFDRAVFQGFPTGATSTILMDMTMVGTNVTPRPVTFTAPTVQTSLGAGGLYARLVSSNGPQSVTVTISGSNDPTGGPSRSNPSFGTTVNGARIVWQ